MANLQSGMLACNGLHGHNPGTIYVKSTKVRSGNNSYEYLSLVEGYRDETGKVCQRILFRLGEASKLRESRPPDIAGIVHAKSSGFLTV